MPSSALLICLLLAVLLVSLDALPFFGFGKESNYEAPSSVFYGRQIQDAPPDRGYVYSRMRG
ncbi:hypothetical protein PRIPAC_95807 [Pristionchus pacificus]|uniref:Uncharacterized protein n=1 Tax=Pristionchus pacificus TaxID=54126 RepID=A0A2A6D0U9_PRIPA|nr:hypothetical protein PRIPAC_95807 [Pristionchus pacificus]|eukprot:PDM83947.1 hypothetical protein PRIPAC_34139 [Pristionchus pacificus]